MTREFQCDVNFARRQVLSRQSSLRRFKTIRELNRCTEQGTKSVLSANSRLVCEALTFRTHITNDTFPVKPDATRDEITAVVNDDEGGGNQIFAQAVNRKPSELLWH
jgi:hypothetical protein